MPRPSEELQMFFTFENDSTNEIFYYRTNQNGSCKRQARYSIRDNILVQKVIAVDENNADFCGQDPDMQLGFESETPIDIVDGQLQLTLPLGEETLTYVWQRKL